MNKFERKWAGDQNARAMRLFADHGRTPATVPMRDWGNLYRTRPGEPLLPAKDPAECGVTSGYRRHIRNGTPVCQLCADAHNRDVKERAAAAA